MVLEVPGDVETFGEIDGLIDGDTDGDIDGDVDIIGDGDVLLLGVPSPHAANSIVLTTKIKITKIKNFFILNHPPYFILAKSKYFITY